MAKKLRVKVEKEFFEDWQNTPVDWLKERVSTIIKEECSHGYKPKDINLSNRRLPSGTDYVSVEMKFKKAKKTAEYKAEVIDLTPDLADQIDSWMNGVTCDTGYEEVARTQPIKWLGRAIGIVIVKA